MTPQLSLARSFRALAAEAVADAVRRRIVPVIAVVALLSLMAVDSCTSCSPTTITLEGQQHELPQAAGWSGLVLFSLLGLWTIVLAGVLASDHLAQTLADGTASLTLARPVGRGSFALARLAGALVIAWATGAVLLLGTGALLHARHGLPLGAAAWGMLACFAGAFVMAALSMSLSLVMPRGLTALLVFGAIGVQATVNAVALFGVELEGVALWVERAGPPLFTALVAALAAWIEPTRLEVSPLEIALRLLLWAVGGAALLSVAFRRIELGR